MGFSGLNTTGNAAAFFVLVLAIPLSIIATGLRFLATRKAGRKPGLEDWLALVALVAMILCASLQLSAAVKLNGADVVMAAVLDPQSFASIMKDAYVAQEFWVLQQVFSKLSILALYRRIFGVDRSNSIWIWIVAAAQIAHGIICIFMQAFACDPVNKFWEPLVPGTCMTKVVLIVAEPINSTIDFALVVLAIFMIRPLQLSTSNKWRLGFLFSLGGLAGVVGFIKIGQSYTLPMSDSFAVLSMWSTLQGVVGIICCCAPVYKPILPQTSFWKHIASSWKSLTSRRYSSMASNQEVSKSRDQLQPPGLANGAWLTLGTTSSENSPPVTMVSQTGGLYDVEKGQGR